MSDDWDSACHECGQMVCGCRPYQPDRPIVGRVIPDAVPRDPEREYERGIVISERPRKPDQLRVDRGDYIRAGGNAECSICGFEYYDHDTVRGFRWLHRACDGRLLKL